MATETRARPLGDLASRPERLPPGPDQGRVAQSVAFHRDPLGFLRRNRERFGDVFLLRLAIAGPMVVISDPSAAEHVVHADPDTGHGGEGRRRILGMVSLRSVLGADGTQHAARSSPPSHARR